MAALRRVLVIALFDVARAYAKPLAILYVVVVPVVAALAIATLFASGARTAPPELAVVDEDGGPQAAAFRDALASVPYTVMPMGRDEAVDAIASGDRRWAVVIPAGFGASGGYDLELLERPGDPGVEAPAVAGLARAIAARTAGGHPTAGPLVSREAPRGGPHDGDVATMRLAYAVFVAILLFVLIGRGASFQRERAAGRLARTVATGVPLREVVASLVVALLIVGAVQAVAFFGATAALGLPWFAGNLGPFAATVAATLLAVAGLAAAITGFARTEAQVQVWSYNAPSLFAMLGGAFWPLDSAPATLQYAARLSPVYWSLEALAGGSVYAGGSAQLVPVAMLVLVGVVGTVAGVQALRRAAI